MTIRIHDAQPVPQIPEPTDKPYIDLYRVSRDMLRARVEAGVIDTRTYIDEVDRRRLYSTLHSEGE